MFFRVHMLPVGLRLALFYVAIFAVVGIHLPFWPVWLKARGLSDSELGLILGAGLWSRVVVNPIVAHMVDSSGRRTDLMGGLAILSVVLCTLFAVTDGFWPLLMLSAALWAAFAALMLLGENLTLLTASTRRLEYGRIRLWGSLSFILVSMTGGVVLTYQPVALILWIMVASMVLTWGACLLLEEPPSASCDRSDPKAFRRVMMDSRFWLFLLATGVIHASHNIYYGFATLHWQGAGLSSSVIGLLWAEAVLAEVVLFAFSNALVTRLHPTGLLILGGSAAVFRWMVLGSSTHLVVLGLVQILHAFTFGAVHLGAMHFMTRAAPPEASTRVQAFYGSVTMGMATGLAIMAAGPLYHALNARAFYVSVGLAIVGGVTAVFLHHRWHGERLGL